MNKKPKYLILVDDLDPLPAVYDPDYHICNNAEYYAQIGLPSCRVCLLCGSRECPYCGGHVVVDDTTCDDCGRDEEEYYELQREEQKT